MSGDVFCCHHLRESATGISWEGTRDAAEHLSMHKAAPPAQGKDLAQAMPRRGTLV